MNSVKVCLICLYNPKKPNEFITDEMSWIMLLKQGANIIRQCLCIII